jgi:hypothetical protein
MSEEKNLPELLPQNVPPEAIPEEKMVDKIPVVIDTTDEAISSAEIVAEVGQPLTTNFKPSTLEEMEVHHHGHVHEKKKWKEYLFQFLMLFLAVFCGFLAEYQLEHKIEKDREEQFITSLVADLQDDVKSLESMIVFESRGIASLDTLISLLNSPEIAKQNGDQLYYVARMGPRSNPFANNSRTFDQLRNSGGFRMIRTTEASNNIMAYYNQFSTVRLLEANYNLEFDNYKRVAAKIFDPAILRRQENELGEILTSTDNPALQTYDAGLLKELGFHTLQMNGSRRGKIVMLENLKKTAVNLKSYLQKEYHLE